jgi:hypothetical protein
VTNFEEIDEGVYIEPVPQLQSRLTDVQPDPVSTTERDANFYISKNKESIVCLTLCIVYLTMCLFYVKSANEMLI